METEIKDVLTRLMESIKLSDKEGIVHGMGEMEGILNQSRAQLHPQLAHFLERRSYAKALDFLGGASDIPRGSCGPR